jgi:D-3-phosphoglycerate dehydrogenase
MKVKTGGGWRSLAGAVVAGAPKIVEVKGMALDAPFQPIMLYINNTDAPGFIGALGTLLGDAKVNIATFHLGRGAAGGEAIAFVGIDEPASNEVMERIKALPQVRYAKMLRF